MLKHLRTIMAGVLKPIAAFMLRLLQGEDPAKLTHFVRPELIIRQDDRLLA